MSRSDDATNTSPTRLRMRVEGMTCTNCEHHVQQALRDAGAINVDADFRRGETAFSMPGASDEGKLRAAVDQAGYRPGTIAQIAALHEPEPDLAEYRLPVEGMTCTDCERHVSEALREVGAVDPVADFRRGEAHFSASPTIDVKRFEDAVAQTTYRPGKVVAQQPERVAARPNGAHGDTDRYGLAILGSGGGAFAAAITAAERGARVVMIERETLGGTCVNIGCVPSKTQLRRASCTGTRATTRSQVLARAPSP